MTQLEAVVKGILEDKKLSDLDFKREHAVDQIKNAIVNNYCPAELLTPTDARCGSGECCEFELDCSECWLMEALGDAKFEVMTLFEYEGYDKLRGLLVTAGIRGKGAPDDSNEIEAFNAIAKEICDLHTRKSADYGDSFHQTFMEEGMAAARIRLSDKLNRFKQLTKSGTAQVKDESIRDTLLDCASYCLLTIMELDREKVNN